MKLFNKIAYLLIVLCLVLVWGMQGCITVDPSKKSESGNTDEERCKKAISSASSESVAKDECVTKTKGLFRHKWWNYYERALCYEEKGDWEKAECYLIKARDQRGKDKWNARTYGTHFVEYFPNRELGIAYYFLGEFDKARTSLENSIKQTPSDKALFYIENTYNALWPKEISSPEISCNIIESPKISSDKQFWTKNDPVNLSITVKDKKYIKSIHVNGEPIYFLNNAKDINMHSELNNGKEKQLIFDTQLFLLESEHKIAIEAKNIGGEKSKREINVSVDRSGPTIEVHSKKLYDKKIIISGLLNDKAGVAELFINATKIPIQQEKEIFFDEAVTTVNDPIQVIASDKLGNQTSKLISLSSIDKDESMLFASADSLMAKDVIVQSPDITPPVINIKNLKNGQELFMRRFFVIAADVEDESKIKFLRVNNKEIPHKEGKSISFNYEIDLQKGAVIEAIDEKDNKACVILREESDNNNEISMINIFSVKKELEEYIDSFSFEGTPGKLLNYVENQMCERKFLSFVGGNNDSGFPVVIANSMPIFVVQNRNYKCNYSRMDDRLGIISFPLEFIRISRFGEYNSPTAFRNALISEIRDIQEKKYDRQRFNIVNCNMDIVNSPVPLLKEDIERTSEVLRNEVPDDTKCCFIRGEINKTIALPFVPVTIFERLITNDEIIGRERNSISELLESVNIPAYYQELIFDKATKYNCYFKSEAIEELKNVLSKKGVPEDILKELDFLKNISEKIETSTKNKDNQLIKEILKKITVKSTLTEGLQKNKEEKFVTSLFNLFIKKSNREEFNNAVNDIILNPFKVKTNTSDDTINDYRKMIYSTWFKLNRQSLDSLREQVPDYIIQGINNENFLNKVYEKKDFVDTLIRHDIDESFIPSILNKAIFSFVTCNYMLERPSLEELLQIVEGTEIKMTIHDIDQENSMNLAIVMTIYKQNMKYLENIFQQLYYDPIRRNIDQQDNVTDIKQQLAKYIAVELPFLSGTVTSKINERINTDFPQKTNIKINSGLIFKNQNDTKKGWVTEIPVGAKEKNSDNVGNGWLAETQ